MKKFLLAIVVAFTAATYTQAQTELYVDYGGYTQMDACDNHDGWGNVKTAWGAVTAGLNFKVRPNFWVGPSYTFSSTKTAGGPASSKIAYNAVMVNGRYEYIKRTNYTIYAHLGLGVEISHMMPKGGDAYNCAYFAVQATPFGISSDISNNVALFGEVGFGAQGLVQVGVRVNL